MSSLLRLCPQSLPPRPLLLYAVSDIKCTSISISPSFVHYFLRARCDGGIPQRNLTQLHSAAKPCASRTLFHPYPRSLFVLNDKPLVHSHHIHTGEILCRPFDAYSSTICTCDLPHRPQSLQSADSRSSLLSFRSRRRSSRSARVPATRATLTTTKRNP